MVMMRYWCERFGTEDDVWFTTLHGSAFAWFICHPVPYLNTCGEGAGVPATSGCRSPCHDCTVARFHHEVLLPVTQCPHLLRYAICPLLVDVEWLARVAQVAKLDHGDQYILECDLLLVQERRGTALQGLMIESFSISM